VFVGAFSVAVLSGQHIYRQGERAHVRCLWVGLGNQQGESRATRTEVLFKVQCSSVQGRILNRSGFPKFQPLPG
jgi:hypothetical protein